MNRVDQIDADIQRARSMDPEDWGPLAVEHLTWALDNFRQALDLVLELTKCTACNGSGEGPFGACPKCDGTGLHNKKAQELVRRAIQ
jgi:hypothetical protein